MANIKKIEGKAGTSFKITVTRGTDSTGKQIRHYKTWKPDRPMTARQMEKEVQRVAYEFEKEIDLGFQADNRQTFEEYANYVISLKERQGVAMNTLIAYRMAMRKICPFIGNMKITAIRPQHLNSLYEELGKSGGCQHKEVVTAKIDFEALVSGMGLNKKEFAQKCGLCDDTIYKLCKGGNLRKKSAERIADFIRKPYEDLFIPSTDGTLSASTIRRIHAFIAVVFLQGEKEMLIQVNPAKRVSLPCQKRHTPVYLQPDQVAHMMELLECEPIKWKTMMHIFLVTGMRKGEVLALKWENINFDTGEMKIDSSLSYYSGVGSQEGETKTRNTRYITVPSETLLLLRKYRAWQAEQQLKYGEAWTASSYVFAAEKGGPMNPTLVNQWLNCFTRKNGLPHVNPHAFRHTAASILISEGVDVVTVSKMLGHANTSMTTDVYSHLIEESKRKATECIADAILRKKKA